MKRSVSIEDLFGPDDSDIESDSTLNLTPQNSPKKEKTNMNNISASDVITIDSDSEKFSSSNSSKGNSSVDFTQKVSMKSLKSIGSNDIFDRKLSKEGVNSDSDRNSRKCQENNEEKHLLESCSSEFPTGKPVCQYGKQCYRKNPIHFKEFDHPDGCLFIDNMASTSSKRQRLNEDAANRKMNSSNEYSKVSESKTDSLPFSFYLTKVRGIRPEHNSKLAIGIKDILSQNLAEFQKSAQFNYCIDIPWLISRYPEELRNKPLLIVHGAKGGEKLSLQEDASQYENVRLCQAPLDFPYGTHHTKMMLLHYNDGLRVVIHTANLVDSDWYQKTQGVWISPLFPKLSVQDLDAGDSSTHFKRDLIEYLSAYKQRSLEEWINIIRQSDMSSAKVVLVGSVPGRHNGEKKNHFGHLKVRKILQELGPEAASVVDWSVIGQFSSVGTLGASSDAWLTSEWLTSLSTVKGLSSAKAKLQLVYPSKENVRCSLEGYPAGAALPYSIHTARKQPYFTSFLHQWKSSCRGRTRASPHIKTYCRASSDGTNIAWFLVTSANMSKAAWGSLEKNGTQLFIRSYELGVLFLPQHFGLKSFSVSNSTVNEGTKLSNCDGLLFPFPFDLPPVPYEKDDRPWIWDIPYVDKPDSNGNMWSPS